MYGHTTFSPVALVTPFLAKSANDRFSKWIQTAQFPFPLQLSTPPRYQPRQAAQVC